MPGDIVEALRRFLSSCSIERGWLVGLAALILYVARAPLHRRWGWPLNSPQLGAPGGRAHPSGYPLYVLWRRAWPWIPGATPAHMAAIATAILGASILGVLHAAATRSARPRSPGLLGAAGVHAGAHDALELARSLQPVEDD